MTITTSLDVDMFFAERKRKEKLMHEKHLTPSEYLQRMSKLESDIERATFNAITVAHHAGELKGRLVDCQNAGQVASKAIIAELENILTPQQKETP